MTQSLKAQLAAARAELANVKEDRHALACEVVDLKQEAEEANTRYAAVATELIRAKERLAAFDKLRESLRPFRPVQDAMQWIRRKK